MSAPDPVEFKQTHVDVVLTATVRAGYFAELVYQNSRLEGAELDNAGGRAEGVFLEAGVAGDTVPVLLPGVVAQVIAGADTTPLSDVASDATGRAIDHPGTVGHYILGQFLGDASAAGQLVDVLLTDPRPFITVA